MRTQLGIAAKQANGLWAVYFETFAGPAGQERMISRVNSAALFDTEDEALAAGQRALDYLEQTGLFPNMCERF